MVRLVRIACIAVQVTTAEVPEAGGAQSAREAAGTTKTITEGGHHLGKEEEDAFVNAEQTERVREAPHASQMRRRRRRRRLGAPGLLEGGAAGNKLDDARTRNCNQASRRRYSSRESQ